MSFTSRPQLYGFGEPKGLGQPEAVRYGGWVRLGAHSAVASLSRAAVNVAPGVASMKCCA